MEKILLDYFSGDELAASTWLKKYAYEAEQTPEDMHHRLAREFAKIESRYPNPLTEEEIFELFDHFKYVIPGGSVMSVLGTDMISSISNCVVVDSPSDSISSIMDTCKDAANLFKRRCGVGFDISKLRPNGALVHNSAKESTGAASFMELFSCITETISQKGRRGALLLSMSVNHPDVIEFIEKKQDLTKVTGANVSVKITDEFMKAVENNTDYLLRWPIDFNPSPEFINDLPYDKLVSIGESFDNPVYCKKIKARTLWNKLVHCAWNTGEPGILFEDTIHNCSPGEGYPQFRTISTNPLI